MNENIQSKELKTSELCMILWKHESQNISFSCPKQSETEDILSKYLSQLYTFGQLDLYTKMREVFGEVFLFFLIFFFFPDSKYFDNHLQLLLNKYFFPQPSVLALMGNTLTAAEVRFWR